MKFKEWLVTEEAKRPIDIPDGVVVVRIMIAKTDPYFYFADAETLQETEEEEGYGWSRYTKPHGNISVHAEGKGVYRVGNVIASDGWGPLLHDLAMEYATSHGKGLGPDYRENSPDSMAVWNYYHDKRDDVSKTKAPRIAPQYKDWKASHYLYSKQNTVTNEMLEAGLLIIKS